ncbi:ABC transporter permease [Homoserinimonas sp. A447]
MPSRAKSRLAEGDDVLLGSASRPKDPAIAGVTVAIALAALMLIIPIVTLVWTALTVDGQPSLGNISRVVDSPAFGTIVINTLIVGVGTVVLAMAIAIPLCWLYARTDFRAKNFLLFTLVVQVGVPGFLIALGYTYLANPSNGIANVWWHDLTGSTEPLFDVYSLPWITVLQGLGLVSLTFFLLVPAFGSIDSSIEEAGTVHGVGKFVTAVRLSIPVIWPTILATTIVVFIIAIEMFDYAGMLGMPKRIFVLSTWIYTAIQGSGGLPDYGLASAVGLLGAAVVGLLMIGYYRAVKSSARLATVSGKRAARPPVALSGRTRVFAFTLFLLFVAISVVIPVAMLVWTSLLPYVQPPSLEALAQISFKGYQNAGYELEVVGLPTVMLVVSVATATVLLSACAAWFVERTRARGRHLLDLLIMMSLAIPSIVMAVAFLRFGLTTYQFLPLAGTVAFLVIAVSTRFIATTHRTISGAVIQLHPELEEAASASGVPRGRTFFRVVLPAIRESLIFSWFWVALLALRELTIVLMLSSPSNQVLSTRIFFYSTSGDTTTASALGVLQLVFMAVLVAGCFPALRRARV